MVVRVRVPLELQLSRAGGAHLAQRKYIYSVRNGLIYLWPNLLSEKWPNRMWVGL